MTEIFTPAQSAAVAQRAFADAVERSALLLALRTARARLIGDERLPPGVDPKIWARVKQNIERPGFWRGLRTTTL